MNTRRERRFRRAYAYVLVGVLLAFLAAIVSVPGPASAETPELGPWLFWNSPTPQQQFVALSQQFTPQNLAPTIFWSTQWFWNSSPDGGYAGIQTDGERADGTVGPMAIFSVWDATKAAPGPGSTCIPFVEQGAGLSCRAPFTVRAGDTYRVDVAVTHTDANGRWWHAHVTDETTGAAADLGEVAVPANASAYEPATFVEYFGTEVACGQEPIVTTAFDAPMVTPVGSTTPLASTYQQATQRSCARAQVTPTATGATMTFGGPQPWMVPNVAVRVPFGVPTVSWGTVQSDGGSPVTGYTVEYSPDGGATWNDAADVGSTERAVTLHLAVAGRFMFRVAAVNAAGTGAWTLTAPLLVDAGPVALMTAPAASIATSTRFTVAWHASGPANIVRYQVEKASSVTGRPLRAWSVWKSKTTITSTSFGGRRGYTYCFRVRATDALNVTSAWSSAMCTGVPSAS